MNKNLIIVMFILLASSLQANDLVSFANKWYAVEYNTHPGCSNCSDYYNAVSYSLGKDTVFSGLQYTCFWKNDSIYVGAIRFSKDGSKTYYLIKDKEFLLYDFMANVGDTLLLFSGYLGADCLKVVDNYVEMEWKVDEVLTIDNRKHIFLHCLEQRFSDCKVEWIEGIGTSNVIFPEPYSISMAGGPSLWTICAFHDDLCLYSFDLEQIGLYNDCPSWRVIDDKVPYIIDDSLASEETYNIFGQKTPSNTPGLVIKRGKCFYQVEF